jgi:hypothetical protein
MTVFMDKIVDHLFILEVKVLWRPFQETTFRATKTVLMLSKRGKQSREERLEAKQPLL